VDIISESTERGVVERRFDLKVADEVVPGIIWTPEGTTEPRPLILIGHGGTQHKRVANVLGLARRFVRHLGFSAVAIDAPDHGERVTDDEAANVARQRLEGRIASGPGRGTEVSDDEARRWVERAKRGTTDWMATIDALEAEPGLSDGRFGYWGLSMGTLLGVPLVAREPRISAAVLGLAGLGKLAGGSGYEAAARSISIPILFVFQWHDELMSRQSGIDLFDALGSTEKTMHVNPGGHVAIPLFERDSYDDFFRRHLGSG
jgi:dienelactone hydrolase